MGQSTSLPKPENGSLPADLKSANHDPKAGFETQNSAHASSYKALKITLDAYYTPEERGIILKVLNFPLDELYCIKPLGYLKKKIEKSRKEPFTSLEGAMITLQLKKKRAVKEFDTILNLVKQGFPEDEERCETPRRPCCQKVLARWRLDGLTAGMLEENSLDKDSP